MYVPYDQNQAASAVFEVRMAGEPARVMTDIRSAVRAVQPDLPLPSLSTQIEQNEKGFAQERAFAVAYALFGALALLLACIGLFGLMSYTVAQRTNEIGIRMALGAEGREVLRGVMRESMMLVLAGVGIGLAVAMAGRTFVASQLFGVAPTDGLTIFVAVGVMVLVSTLAAYLPARRASRIEPMVALRYE